MACILKIIFQVSLPKQTSVNAVPTQYLGIHISVLRAFVANHGVRDFTDFMFLDLSVKTSTMKVQWK